MSSSRRTSLGFTIVELLVASAITLGIVVLLGVIFGSITKTSSRANQRTDAFRDARAALQIIARDLGDLVPNQRDASGTAITLPAAYFVCTTGGSTTDPKNIYPDPADGNQQLYALVAAKNSGSGDVCSVGYYCRWDDQHYNYSLRRFFRDSTQTYTTLSSLSGYAKDSNLYFPDPLGTTGTSLKDELVAANIWNLKITAYDKTGAAITAFPYECDPGAGTSNPLPATLEISFKAMSPEAARTVISSKATADVWMNESDPTYQRLIAPNIYSFRTRIYFDQ
jgi:type II secretory pathway pseudopilin PulG